MWLSFPYSWRVALISHCHVANIPIQLSCGSHFALSCGSHFHCRVALICIRRNPNPNSNLGHEPSGGSHSHTVGVWLLFRIVMWLTLPYSCRVVLISHCHVALISIVGRFSFCNVMWLSFYIVVWLSFPLISSQGLYFGTRLYRPYRLHGLSRVQATGPTGYPGSRLRAPRAIQSLGYGPHGLSRV